MYWSRLLDLPLINDTLTPDTYFKLCNHLHFVNNLHDQDRGDKLWKVRPVINVFRNKCLALPRSKHLSIDEQMIPFSGRCAMRTCVPSKPNPLGLKNFILETSEGLVLDFIIYTGKGTVPDTELKEIDLGASVIKLLTVTVPNNGQHVIYSDRFFTDIKSIELLLSNNISNRYCNEKQND
ncbi:uncharacterized protein LOC126334834 [Schistocerca gregaria]|uniref:uncharacterized protein LOC126334834 n=1 Tax=Schistocerca gregaria TaxID=7010 RepID=UPI00211DD679|nr:uncharacterized protein LOC126334834 [Schistocerca gregaria]